MTGDDLRKEQSLPGIQAASFSADGKVLITGSSDGVLAVWDAGTGLGRAQSSEAPRSSPSAYLLTEPFGRSETPMAG